jgi:hypothetical protein
MIFLGMGEGPLRLDYRVQMIFLGVGDELSLQLLHMYLIPFQLLHMYLIPLQLLHMYLISLQLKRKYKSRLHSF